MKKKNLRKNVYFGIFLATLMMSTMFLATDVFAVTPDELFDTEFDTQIEALMNPAKVESLALSIIDGTEVVYEKGYGEQNETDIVYYINQISGCIATTALLQLMDDGLFDINDPVNDYLPWSLVNPNYPSDDITIYDILAWKAGLTNSSFYYTMALWQTPPFPDVLYEMFNEAGANYSSTFWKNWAPGTSFTSHVAYYDFTAYLVELISGEPYEQYITNNILVPLGMTNTDFTYTNFTLEQLATQYDWSPSTMTNVELPYLDFYPGSLGVFSTVEDISNFLIALMNGGVYDSVRILEESSVNLMHTNLGNDRGFGWTFNILNEYYQGLLGAWGGATFMLTKQNLGIVIFTNQADISNLVDQINDIAEYIFPIAEELIPPTTTTNFELFALPVLLAVVGTIILHRRRNKK
jgi:CubicO group peptidase (beta-lactamase class C family)